MGFWKSVKHDIMQGIPKDIAIKLNAEAKYCESKQKRLEAEKKLEQIAEYRHIWHKRLIIKHIHKQVIYLLTCKRAKFKYYVKKNRQIAENKVVTKIFMKNLCFG